MWTPLEERDLILAQQVTHWIRTVRDSNPDHPSYGPSWLPSYSDFIKSALFERIRSGKDPLPEPPPVGLACPWYAVVEDRGPHFVFEVSVSEDHGDRLFVLQNPYRIYEMRGDRDYIVGDARGTSYRFRVWYDEQWEHPRAWCAPDYFPPKGGWMIQNMTFVEGPAE